MRQNLNNDGIGYVELHDFSTANRSYEDRVKAVQLVASVCYNSTLKVGSDRIFKMLSTESKGLPSSSYEFVPVLLDYNQLTKVHEIGESGDIRILDTEKYGEFVEGGAFLLTNLRALIGDVGERSDEFYNTSEEELAIIKKHFKVFKSKIDLSTRAQLVRHRNASYQELSRRYVSGSKLEFEFYISPELKKADYCDSEGDTSYSISEIYHQQVQHYNSLIDQGVKPEQARRILPQAAYTVLWSAWLPESLNGMLELRTHKTAQTEIRNLANGIVYLLNEQI